MKVEYVELIAQAEKYVRNAPRWKSHDNQEAETAACLLIRELIAALNQVAPSDVATSVGDASEAGKSLLAGHAGMPVGGSTTPAGFAVKACRRCGEKARPGKDTCVYCRQNDIDRAAMHTIGKRLRGDD